MDEAIGQRPSITPPVVIASLGDEEAGPSCSSAQAEPGPSTSGDAQQEGGGRRKRRRTADPVQDELLDLIRQDMREQREADQKRDQQNQENMNSLLQILGRIADK